MMLAYDITMRTIIDIPREQIEVLSEFCQREKLSRAEAVRKAIGRYLKDASIGGRAAAFGIWKKRKINALKYEDRLRGEWGARR